MENRAHVEFLGVERGNGTLLTHKHNTSAIDTNPVSIYYYPDHTSSLDEYITNNTFQRVIIHLLYGVKTRFSLDQELG